MGRKVDVNDLIDSAAVAELLGLADRHAVYVYRRRYDDFPAPVVSSDKGRCLLWVRRDVEAWAKTRR